MNLNPVTTLMLIWVLFGLGMWIVGLLVARHWARRNQLLFLRTSLRQALERGRAAMPALEPIAIGVATSRVSRRSERVEKKSDAWPTRQQRSNSTVKQLFLPRATRTTG